MDGKNPAANRAVEQRLNKLYVYPEEDLGYGSFLSTVEMDFFKNISLHRREVTSK